MKSMIVVLGLVSAVGLALASGQASVQIAKNVAAKSPWGPADEIGTLNMMSDASRFDVLQQITGGKVYDLGVELFVGMPTCCAPFGDPTFQIFMTHTPAQDSVAKSKNVLHLGASYAITVADRQEALQKQATALRPG